MKKRRASEGTADVDSYLASRPPLLEEDRTVERPEEPCLPLPKPQTQPSSSELRTVDREPSRSSSKIEAQYQPSLSGSNSTSTPLPPTNSEKPSRLVSRCESSSGAKLPTDPCGRCRDPRSEHKIDKDKRHIHFRTAAGDEKPRLFVTRCFEPYCHLPLCACMGFVEADEQPVSSFSMRWCIENGLVSVQT